MAGFGGSGCTFLLKFCLVFYMLVDAFNAEKSLRLRSLRLNYLECKDQSPFVKVESVIFCVSV